MTIKLTTQLSILALTITPVLGAVVVPVSVDDTAANTFGAGGATFEANNLIGAAHVTTLSDAPADSDNWVSSASAPDYFAAGPVNVFIFDLGADTDLGSIHYWAYSNGTGVPSTSQNNSARTFSLRFATDADGTAGFGTTVTLNPLIDVANTVPTDGAGSGVAQPVQSVGFGSVINARYVEMSVIANYFGEAGGAGGDRVGFNEIAFDTVSVPEPSSTALLGLGGLALMLRRRK